MNKRHLVRDGIGIVVVAIMFAFTVAHQRNFYDGWWEGSGKYVQKTNIPDADVIRLATLGYDNMYANFLTLRAVQAFGAAWDTEDQSVEPIYNYFDILTTLDPHFIEVYELGHLVIADDHRAFDEGLSLVRKGNRWNWREWRIPYLGLYTTLWDMDDPEAAREFLLALRRIPKAPEHILRMDEYVERQSGRYEVAYDMNLSHYLRYIELDMEVEQGVALRKFQSILDPWYRTELARAADNFHQAHERHPLTTEELLASEHVPRFEAPTLDSLIDTVQRYMERPGNLENYRDEIREASMVEIVGMPPEPWGRWYFIDSEAREEAELRFYDPEMPLLDQFNYFTSVSERMEEVDMQGHRTSGAIMAEFERTNELPTYEDLASILRIDNLGGHWVYKSETGAFFSTAQMRLREGADPRMGFRGGMDRLPRRTLRVSEDQPPYLTLEPTIWDFEEDAQWALCKGLIPGVPFRQQPPELQAKAHSEDGNPYLPCDDHIPDPLGGAPTGGLPDEDDGPIATAPATEAPLTEGSS